MVGRTDYQERKEEKIGRYKNNAVKAKIVSNHCFNNAQQLGKVIPFGQPILEGHHSEKGHRRLLKKIDNSMRKSIEADDKAEYYLNKAKNAESNHAISSDDTEAVNRLNEKLKENEETKEYYKAVNKAWLKDDKQALYKLGLTDTGIEKLKSQMFPRQTKPFASWQLNNINAEIRRIKKRLEELEILDEMQEETVKFLNGEVRVNTEINRIQFVFNEIPSEEIRKILKSNGFKWSPKERAWQRQRTLNAMHATKRLIKQYFDN